MTVQKLKLFTDFLDYNIDRIDGSFECLNRAITKYRTRIHSIKCTKFTISELSIDKTIMSIVYIFMYFSMLDCWPSFYL
jgi:hypothetical protein